MEAKQTIYISLPMSGQMDTVQERLNAATAYAEKRFPGYRTVTPAELAALADEAHGAATPYSQPTGAYLSLDIAFIVERADAILLCPGWEKSKGCTVEKATAEAYGKEVLYMETHKQDTMPASKPIYKAGDVVRYLDENTVYISGEGMVDGVHVFVVDIIMSGKLHKSQYIHDYEITRRANGTEIDEFNERLHTFPEGYRKHYSKTTKQIVNWYEKYDRVIVENDDKDGMLVDLFLTYHRPNTKEPFYCLLGDYNKCIPFNEENRKKYNL